MERNYSDADVYRALEEIEEGATIAASARKYGIPRSTLSEKRSGRHPIERRMGPDTVLSQEEENLLQKWIFHVADAGFPVSKEQLLDSVQVILKKANRQTVFTNNRPGRKWYAAFRRRHPAITEKQSQNLNRARASVSEESLRGWYGEVRESLTKMGYLDILNDPERIFNMDESGFYLSPKPGKVLARRGQGRVYSRDGDEKEVITTLIGGNAKGVLTPSMVLFPYQRLPKNIVDSVPDSWAHGRSPNGWMTCETFYEYITNCFHPWLLSTHTKLPVILFVDGHASHISYHLSEFCADKGIILTALFPNATHIHQPMDVSVFHSLKTNWVKAVRSWRMANDGVKLNREKFSPLLKEVLDRDIKVSTVSNGFKKSGLYPFDADAIDYGQLIKKPRAEEVPQNDFVNSAPNAFLEQFEQQLDPSILLSFKNSAPELNAQSENASLFKFWKQIGGCSSDSSEEKENDVQYSVSAVSDDIVFEYLDQPYGEDEEDCFSQEQNIKVVNLINATDEGTQDEGSMYTASDCVGDLRLVASITDKNRSVIVATVGSYGDLQFDAPLPNEEEPIDLSNFTIAANECVQSKSVHENDTVSIAHVYETESPAETVPEAHENIQTGRIQLIEDTNPSVGPVVTTSHIPSGFPNYFRDALFWPGRKPVGKSVSNRKPAEKEKVPAVMINKEFREYLKKKEDEKEKLEKEKADRKIERELNKIEKQRQVAEKEKRKAEREAEKQKKYEEKEKEKIERQLSKQKMEADRAIEIRRKEEKKLKEKAERQLQGKRKHAEEAKRKAAKIKRLNRAN